MNWQSSILPLLLLLNAGIALVILQAAWQRRRTRGATPFCFLVLSVAVWSFTAAIELLSSDLSQKVFWSKLQYLGIATLPTMWLLFAWEYSQIVVKNRRVSRLLRVLIWIIPAITLLLVFTNERHGLIWNQIVPIQNLSSAFVLFQHGIWFWVFAVYSYITILAGTLLLIFGAARFSPDYRRQTIALLIGAAIPWIANIAYLAGLTAWVGIDLTPIAFCLTSVIYAYQVFRFQLFDLVPIARDTIIESMTDGVVVLDLSGRIAYINPAARSLLKTGDVIGKPAKENLTGLPVLSLDLSKDVRQVIEFNTNGHSLRYFDYHASALRGQRGNPTGQVVVFRDITERKQEDERFGLLINAAPDGIIVINQNGIITLANRRAEQMLGFQANELSSQPLTNIVPEQYTQSFKMVENFLQNPDQAKRFHGREVQALCKDGSMLPVEITLSQLGTPDGPLILAIMRDISQQKASEEQINQQSVALAAAASAILITDSDGRITWVNPAFTNITGYSTEEAIGNKPSILKSGTHDEQFYTSLWETILSGKNWHGELTNRRKDGSLFTEEATIAPVRNTRGEITHFIAIKQDVSKRKQLEQMRDDLMQTIVHDLRNPLTSILFALDMLKDQPDILRLPPEMAMMLAISRDNSWRMLGMVNAMLDYNRLESGKMPLQREPITLAEMVEQSFRFQSQLAARRELLLLNDVPYDLPTVSADRTLVSRVLQNLIDNSIKYAPPGSNINIQANLDASRNAILVSVHDQGPGIPPELSHQLFQKFASGTSSRGGTGLGLAFCRLAIEAHQGEIWVEGEAGQGTTFVFSLPLDENPEIIRSSSV